MTPPDDMEDMDPGLARERTELAWSRTAISFATLGGAVLKAAPAIGLLVLGMSALVFVLGRLVRPAERAGRHERRQALLMVTAAVTAMSAAALVATFLPRS